MNEHMWTVLGLQIWCISHCEIELCPNFNLFTVPPTLWTKGQLVHYWLWRKGEDEKKQTLSLSSAHHYSSNTSHDISELTTATLSTVDDNGNKFCFTQQSPEKHLVIAISSENHTLRGGSKTEEMHPHAVVRDARSIPSCTREIISSVSSSTKVFLHSSVFIIPMAFNITITLRISSDSSPAWICAEWYQAVEM